ncbi:hypothetical protein AAMO2058_001189100 [Amorphochlora amoebiformis]
MLLHFGTHDRQCHTDCLDYRAEAVLWLCCDCDGDRFSLMYVAYLSTIAIGLFMNRECERDMIVSMIRVCFDIGFGMTCVIPQIAFLLVLCYNWVIHAPPNEYLTIHTRLYVVHLDGRGIWRFELTHTISELIMKLYINMTCFNMSAFMRHIDKDMNVLEAYKHRHEYMNHIDINMNVLGHIDIDMNTKTHPCYPRLSQSSQGRYTMNSRNMTMNSRNSKRCVTYRSTSPLHISKASISQGAKPKAKLASRNLVVKGPSLPLQASYTGVMCSSPPATSSVTFQHLSAV